MTGAGLGQLGLVGLGVMGRSLARNAARCGAEVSAWDRDATARKRCAAEHPGELAVRDTLQDLVSGLACPRRLLMMIPAGDPVDRVLDQLSPLLEAGDMVIDGGNSWYEDTRRRAERLHSSGICWVGMGVSGGERGALEGPSMMVGADKRAWSALRELLEAMAARTAAGPCVARVGSDGAGHFVKMVHNGIEYAEMQLIAEVYDFLRRGTGLDAEACSQVFLGWNAGPLESYLIEITARVLACRDEESGGPLVDLVLDRAGQKGTGRWTASVALELGVAVPTIAAAVDARVLSSLKQERVAAGAVISGPESSALDPGRERLASAEQALLACRVVAYAQGLALIQAASERHEWHVDLAVLARIWRAGCIIRSRFLGRLEDTYGVPPGPTNLILDPEIRTDMIEWVPALRRTIAEAQVAGLPVPAMSASLAYFDAYRSPDLPQNLTQAQRDAFGAHTYLRRDDMDRGPVHTDWLSNGQE